MAKKKEENKKNTKIIIGSAVGAVAVVVIVLCCVFLGGNGKTLVCSGASGEEEGFGTTKNELIAKFDNSGKVATMKVTNEITIDEELLSNIGWDEMVEMFSEEMKDVENEKGIEMKVDSNEKAKTIKVTTDIDLSKVSDEAREELDETYGSGYTKEDLKAYLLESGEFSTCK